MLFIDNYILSISKLVIRLFLRLETRKKNYINNGFGVRGTKGACSLVHDFACKV